MLALQTQRPDVAEQLAAGVLKSNRSHQLAAQILGRALLLQDRSKEAIEPLERAARRGDDPVIETLLARALAHAGRDDEALAHLRRATLQRPPFPLAFLELGERLGKAGRFDEGRAVFESGLALAPDADMLRIGLGNLHLSRNARGEARRLFSQVRADGPQGRDAMLALAGVMALDGEYAAASGLYQRALQLRPDDAVTRISLGRCLLEMGQREAGEASLRAAARSASQLAGPALTTLASASHGRLFLRPGAAYEFLRGGS